MNEQFAPNADVLLHLSLLRKAMKVVRVCLNIAKIIFNYSWFCRWNRFRIKGADVFVFSAQGKKINNEKENLKHVLTS
jgi:hypothetical protein